MENPILPENATRELLENNVIDAELNFEEKRLELERASRLVARQRARLEYFEFLESVEQSFGPEVARQVAEHATYQGAR